MLQITEKKYNEIHPDFRGVWTIERTDLPNWEDERVKYMGKRTMMHNDGGGACLLVEGIGFEVHDTPEDYILELIPTTLY